MSHITNFLPQYRELNTLFTNVVSRGTVNYSEQKVITEFYRQSSDVKVFEKIILDSVLEKDKHTCELLLSGIKTEVENNIRLYESAKESLNAIDTLKIGSEEASRGDYAIKAQSETVAEYSKEVNQINGSLEAIGFREHRPQEEAQLWQQHEYQTKRYNEEKEKLTMEIDFKQNTRLYILGCKIGCNSCNLLIFNVTRGERGFLTCLKITSFFSS